MITPEPLQKGDTIGIVATARKISKEELRPAKALLEQFGYRVKFSPHLFGEDRQFSGSDEERRDDLQQFIDDPEVKAILCARGGYGTVRIVDDINYFPLAGRAKWICGYSDITVLHNKLSLLGIESLHCSMPINFSHNSKMALASLLECLEGNSPSYQWAAHPLNRRGEARGILTGGNLSVIYSQMGSPTALDTEGKILFLEDLDEYLYHIDRMMQNLKRAGYLENLAGLLIGGMTDMNDNTIAFGKTALEIIREQVAEYHYPLAFGCPAGHIDDNRSLIMGRELRLEVGDHSKISFHGGEL